MTYKDLFKETLSDAVKSAKQVSDPYKKATVLASISQALATYLAKNEAAAASIDDAVEEVAQEEKTKATKSKKTAPKAEPAAQEAPAEEAPEEKAEEKPKKTTGGNGMFKRRPRKTDVEEEQPETAEAESAEEAPAEEAEEPAAEEINKKNFTDKWDSESRAYFAEQLGQLNTYKEEIFEQSGGDETMYDQMLDYATNGDITSETQINPLNVEYALRMLEVAMNSDEEEEEEEGNA